MGIRIEKITAENLGPLQRFNCEMKNVNLIYGKNEDGKSFLTEFIIRSLFSGTRQWGELREAGNGRIIVSGFNGQEKTFSPRTKKNEKLDVLFSDENGLSPALAKLLIVKSGEINIAENNLNGIDLNTLKELLSSQKTLNTLAAKISPTIKNSKIDGNLITINRQGEGKIYYDELSNLNKIRHFIELVSSQSETGKIQELKEEFRLLKKKNEKLLLARRYKAWQYATEIENVHHQLENISESELSELETKIKNCRELQSQKNQLSIEIKTLEERTKDFDETKNNFDRQIAAKQYAAYALNKNISELEKQLGTVEEDEISELEKNLKLLHLYQSEKSEKEHKVEQLKRETEHFDWLEKVRTAYQQLQFSSSEKDTLNKILMVLSVVFAAGGLVTLLALKNILFGAILFAGSFIALSFYVFRLQKTFKNKLRNSEWNQIKQEFQEKFHQELNQVNLETLFEALNKKKLELDFMLKEFQNTEQNILKLTATVKEELRNIFGEEIEMSEIYERLSSLKKQRNALNHHKEQLKQELMMLQVDVSDYSPNDPGVAYSKNLLDSLSKKMNEFNIWREQKEEKETRLRQLSELTTTLKNEILESFRSIFGTEISENKWEQNITELRQFQTQLKEKLSGLTGELKGLGVSPQDYVQENQEIEFSVEELNKVQTEMEILKDKISELENGIDKLKSEICTWLNLDFTTGWNEVVENLYEREKEILSNLKKNEAYIVAGNVLYKTIEQLQQQEGEELAAGINSGIFTNLLYRLTGKYNKLEIVDNEIIISSENNSWLLKELSTGTKEQVMLALRVTLAQRALNETAFLMLDDAFQHSDYERRPKIIDQLFELSTAGWQIIYLTMDEHIRHLFNQTAQHKQFLENYQEICLS
ncbi:MAG: AAA family ATPase [Paludibacteraceae bacterium]|nr:AAA family ATPase [Paludibacteraceae bacterium]OPZ02586.1 MAG: Chromosome partition protein Smc [Bacteroidetes bacterium ADurb.BinA395]